MSNTFIRAPRTKFFVTVTLILLTATLFAATPQGWIMAGSKPTAYESGIDANTLPGNGRTAYLKSIRPDICDETGQSTASKNNCSGFGTLMQSFAAEQYQGKRIRFSASVKSDSVDEWAGLWMRVDKGSTIAVAFDNMQDRPIKGTTGWQNYQVVLDVPSDATSISFGILLGGHGQVWMNDVKFEIVGSDVPVTGKKFQTAPAPANLSFEN